MDVNVKYFLEWKKAYKECKKQASVMVKDKYDTEFLKKIKDSYKNNFKNKIEIEVKDAIKFFLDVINTANVYLEKENQWSKFYKENRKKAVQELI